MVLNIAWACRDLCNGKVYLALMPHPENWHKLEILDENPVELWELKEIWTPTVE